MKPILPFYFALLLTSPALALEVTNFDTVEHRILFEAGGSAKEYTVPVDRTVYIAGQPNGRLSLLTAPKQRKAKDTVQTDGLLSEFLGNKRTSGIPAETNDAFVIWKGGEMGIQQRRRGGRYGN